MSDKTTTLLIAIDKVIEDKAVQEMESIMYKHLLTAREEMDYRMEKLVKEMAGYMKDKIKEILKEKVIIKK